MGYIFYKYKLLKKLNLTIFNTGFVSKFWRMSLKSLNLYGF